MSLNFVTVFTQLAALREILLLVAYNSTTTARSAVESEQQIGEEPEKEILGKVGMRRCMMLSDKNGVSATLLTSPSQASRLTQSMLQYLNCLRVLSLVLT